MAGRGGLTGSESLDLFVARHGAASVHLRPMPEAFPPYQSYSDTNSSRPN
jgi:hypothetical protein